MFETGNYIEAGLWILIALAFAASCVWRGSDRIACTMAAFTFLHLGVSDIVEVQTGAWCRPTPPTYQPTRRVNALFRDD